MIPQLVAQFIENDFEHVWPKTTVARFQHMQFVNDSVAIGVSDFSILRSDDGAKTWRRLPIYTFSGIICAHFINPEIGLAGATDGTIFRTENGGIDWQIVFQDTQAYPMDDKSSIKIPLVFRQFEAPDSNNIYAMTDTRYIFHSTNQGLSWRRYDTQFTAHQLEEFEFVNHQVGYILANFHLLKTTNGGANWSLINRNAGPPDGRLRNSLGKHQMICWDETNSYLLPYDDLGVYTTTDGGINWAYRSYSIFDSAGKQLNTGQYTSVRVWNAVFADSLFGLFLVDDDYYKWLGYTIDGGRTIRFIPGSKKYRSLIMPPFIGYNRFTDQFIFQADDNIVLAIGRDLSIRQVSDGEYKRQSRIAVVDSNHFILRPFHYINTPVELTHVIHQQSTKITIPWGIGDNDQNEPFIAFADSKVGYALALSNFNEDRQRAPKDKLIRTSDGGWSWKALLSLKEQPNMGTWICSFKVLSADSLYLLTLDSTSRSIKFWRSADSGASWTMIFNQFHRSTISAVLQSYDLRSLRRFLKMDFWDAERGILYVGGNHFLRTDDAGNSWSYYMIGDTNLLDQRILPQISSNIQLKGNGHGTILWGNDSDHWPIAFSTTNYGISWTQAVIRGVTYPKLIMPAESKAYIFRSTIPTVIFETVDDGAIWNPFYAVATARMLDDMDFYSPTGGFAIDVYGNVYRVQVPFINRQPIVLNDTYQDLLEHNIYPNPTDGLLHVLIQNPEPSRIRIFDLGGKQLLERQATEMGRLDFNLEAFSPGIYILYINNNGQQTAHKVVRY